ncbi:phenylalanyl-tRNA synthetase [Dorcoceras hygrometricum]|uniref:Phenylalanyl-tRNA synthetase n=1 Tax=Dorcoceras hygrometricum TaxID=472368 RepID=A0A2Z6ZRJ1_9LAMI|nr:phenylalanyl-tRNA synthetase [Dorcoceras hygrometricum]
MDVGIDQLNFHSAQLGYLKLLQMGNAYPNKTKAGNKYEVKPQYKELSKQINMQHAINQCYECMRLSKEIGQLDQCINRKIISSHLYTTVYQPGNHRSVIIGARQPITARR